MSSNCELPNQSSVKSIVEHSFSKSSVDLTPRVGTWLRSGLALSKPASDEIASEFQRLDTYYRLPGFRLAIIGEFSRGKSTFINHLLGRDLLPTGVLPTTATLTSIVAGSEDCLNVHFADGHREARRVEESSWNDLLAADQIDTEQKLTTGVQLTLNHPWLQEMDIELFDTPGIGDPNSHRASVVSQLLSQCDATVLLVSATMPFSLTEASFLEQEVLGRRIPRILIVVSKLDTIPQDQCVNVLDTVRERVAKISTEIPVLPLYPVGSNATQEEALVAVRTQIEAMVAKEGRRATRSQRVAEQIVDQLNQLIRLAETAIAAIRMSIVEREKALQKAQAEIRKAELEWEDIRLELDRRRLQHDQKIRQDVVKAKTELMESLRLDLKKTADPKNWWERDLPPRMKRELANLARKSENLLMADLARDSEWFKAEAARIFAIKLAQKNFEVSQVGEITPSFRQIELTDIQQQRFWSRISSGAGMASSTVISTLAVGVLPVAILGIAASVGVGLFFDQHMQKSVEKQRDLLSEELEVVINRVVDEYCAYISNQLRQLYHQLIEYSQHVQTAWQSAKESAFKAKDRVGEKDCQEIINKATSLKEEIITNLNTVA